MTKKKEAEPEPEEKGLSDIAEKVPSNKGEIDTETGKVKDEDGGTPEDHRDIQVAGTRLGEPVEPAKEAYVPLPEKPKYGVGEVSTRALNSLPDGGSYPEEAVAPVDLRESIRKGQQEKKANESPE